MKSLDSLGHLDTEQVNSETSDIDTLSTYAALELINSQDAGVPVAVRRELTRIAEATDLVVAAIQSGGRLIYVGAGTSGRLGILDASEMPPTYGVSSDTIQGILAGGIAATAFSNEPAEDSVSAGMAALQELRPTSIDVVCGIAASGRTPFVQGALGYASDIGCKTILVSCVSSPQVRIPTDIAICVPVGPEVIMGSTRMKSGTAQKLVLNMITTVSMIKLGKVYKNLMVDLDDSNSKLAERSIRIVAIATGLDYDSARDVLLRSDGHVKKAIVMALANVSASEAQERLELAGGLTRLAIGDG
jgi:N-acetylmuramic acid 6-phosphate etherase